MRRKWKAVWVQGGGKAGTGPPQQALTDEHTSDFTLPSCPTDFHRMDEEV